MGLQRIPVQSRARTIEMHRVLDRRDNADYRDDASALDSIREAIFECYTDGEVAEAEKMRDELRAQHGHRNPAPWMPDWPSVIS